MTKIKVLNPEPIAKEDCTPGFRIVFENLALVVRKVRQNDAISRVDIANAMTHFYVDSIARLTDMNDQELEVLTEITYNAIRKQRVENARH